MKPIIGICANYSNSDSVGVHSGQGLAMQSWQLLAADYTNAVATAGGCPVILPVVGDVDSIWPLAAKLDGIIFTGGSDIDPRYYNETPQKGLGMIAPERDRFEFELCSRILNETKIPVFGICRGLQLINVSLGGTLYQDLGKDWNGHNHTLLNYPQNYSSHIVHIQENSRLYELSGSIELWVNSFHHQAVKLLGEGLIASVIASDCMIEGIELEGARFVAAV